LLPPQEQEHALTNLRRRSRSMSIVLRVPGLVPEEPAEIERSDWFLLRCAARWRDDPELEPGATPYLYSAPVNAIVAKGTLGTVSVFTYRDHDDAAQHLDDFFLRAIDPTHALIRTAAKHGHGLAVKLCDAEKVWRPRPAGLRVYGSFAVCTDPG